MTKELEKKILVLTPEELRRTAEELDEEAHRHDLHLWYWSNVKEMRGGNESARKYVERRLGAEVFLKRKERQKTYRSQFEVTPKVLVGFRELFKE